MSIKSDWQKFLSTRLDSHTQASASKLPKSLFYVTERVNPQWSKVLIKLGLIQLVTLLATLSICPQWGVGLIGGFEGMRALFMIFGHLVCEFLCGAFYAGSFLLSMSWFLDVFENRKAWSQPMALGLGLFFSTTGFLWFMSSAQGPIHVHMNDIVSLHIMWWLGYLLAYILLMVWNIKQFTISKLALH